jgi:hypothetical protein
MHLLLSPLYHTHTYIYIHTYARTRAHLLTLGPAIEALVCNLLQRGHALHDGETGALLAGAQQELAILVDLACMLKRGEEFIREFPAGRDQRSPLLLLEHKLVKEHVQHFALHVECVRLLLQRACLGDELPRVGTCGLQALVHVRAALAEVLDVSRHRIQLLQRVDKLMVSVWTPEHTHT